MSGALRKKEVLSFLEKAKLEKKEIYLLDGEPDWGMDRQKKHMEVQSHE